MASKPGVEDTLRISTGEFGLFNGMLARASSAILVPLLFCTATWPAR